MHVPVVVDRHDHEKGRPDPLKVRIFELGVASGRTADKNRFPDRAGPAVQKRDPQFREDLRVEAFSLLDPVSQRRCRVQAVRYLHGHELQQFAETDILRGLHPAVAPDDALDLPDQEVGFVQPSVEGCLGRVPADVGVIFQFVLYFDQILGRDQGAHLQVVHRKLVQVHRGYEEVRVRDDVFVDLSLAVSLEDRLVSQLILESCHHQSRHAESAGADNADTDFAGVLFVFPDSLLRRAEVHGQESDFRLVDLVSGLFCDHGGSPAAGLEDIAVLLLDVIKDRIVDPEAG